VRVRIFSEDKTVLEERWSRAKFDTIANEALILVDTYQGDKIAIRWLKSIGEILPRLFDQVVGCSSITSNQRYDAPIFGEALMKSGIVKRSVVVDGHKTSVSLEDQFWNDLKAIARAHGATLSKIVSEIDNTRRQSNLSSALRLFVLDQVRTYPDRDLRSSTGSQASAISA